MIRSYSHKGFVLEVSVEATFNVVSTTPREPASYLAIVTISRAGRPVTSFSPLDVTQRHSRRFGSIEQALMTAHSAGQTFVDDWMRDAR